MRWKYDYMQSSFPLSETSERVTEFFTCLILNEFSSGKVQMSNFRKQQMNIEAKVEVDYTT